MNSEGPIYEPTNQSSLLEFSTILSHYPCLNILHNSNVRVVFLFEFLPRFFNWLVILSVNTYSPELAVSFANTANQTLASSLRVG